MNNKIILKTVEIILYPFIYIGFCIYIMNFSNYHSINTDMFIVLIFLISIIFLIWIFSQYKLNKKKCILIIFYTIGIFFTIKNDFYNKLNSYEYENIEYQILSNELVKNTKHYKEFLEDKKNNDPIKINKYITIKKFNGGKLKLIGNEDLRSIPENKYIQILAMRILLNKDFEDISKKIDEIIQDDFISINEYESIKKYYVEKKINKDGLNFFSEK